MSSGVICSHQEVVSMSVRITVSLPDPLLSTLDQLARRWSTTRSGAVTELLRLAEQQEVESQMREGYLALAESHRADAELFLPAQVEVLQNGS
jgi:metal-responsive CopG/Arc/MetJ family transcriptional regulator